MAETAKERFWREWAIDGMPKDKQRLAEAAWADATEAVRMNQAAGGEELTDARIESALNATMGLDHTLRQLVRGDTMPIGYSKVAVVRALLTALGYTAPPAAQVQQEANDGPSPVVVPGWAWSALESFITIAEDFRRAAEPQIDAINEGGDAGEDEISEVFDGSLSRAKGAMKAAYNVGEDGSTIDPRWSRRWRQRLHLDPLAREDVLAIRELAGLVKGLFQHTSGFGLTSRKADNKFRARRAEQAADLLRRQGDRIVHILLMTREAAKSTKDAEHALAELESVRSRLAARVKRLEAIATHPAADAQARATDGMVTAMRELTLRYQKHFDQAQFPPEFWAELEAAIAKESDHG